MGVLLNSTFFEPGIYSARLMASASGDAMFAGAAVLPSFGAGVLTAAGHGTAEINSGDPDNGKVTAPGVGAAAFTSSATKSSAVNAAGAGSASLDAINRSYRYWRLNVNATLEGNYIAVPELELYTSYYGPNVATGGTAFASSSFWTVTPDMAFDGDISPGNRWVNDNGGLFPEWVAYDFGAGNPKEIIAIGIHSQDAPNRMPIDFDVQGSNDGSSWTTVWSETVSTDWTPYEFRRFVNPAISAPTVVGSPWGAHPVWRLAIVDTQSSGDYSAIAELELRDAPGGVDQTGTGTPAASSILSGTYSADKAFDNDNATFWHSSGGGYQWLTYTFGTPREVAQIALRSRPDSLAGRTPSVFALQFAETTSGPWTTVMKKTTETGWSLGETRVYTDPAWVLPVGTVASKVTAQGTGAAAIRALVPARYWRTNITAQNGTPDGYTTIVEMGMYTSVGGSNVCSGGTATESGHFGGAVAARMFDGSTATEWSSPGPSVPNWVGYDFGAGNEKSVIGVSFTSGTSPYNGRAPKDFTLQYSFNGTTWFDLFTVTNATGWGSLETRTFYL